MFDLWSAGHSVLREKVLEHIFLAELSKVLLLKMHTPFEVLRAEFDAHGYDIVLEARGILRHVQLKAMRKGGKRTRVDISRELERKSGGCVIWHVVDENTLALGPFFWLGGAPGEPLPALEGRVTRHTRPNAAGLKAERQGLREIRMAQFTRLNSMEEVARALFGQGALDHTQLLEEHLAEREIRLREIEVPEDLNWASSSDLAHLIDGYALAEVAGLGDSHAFQARMRREAERSRRWEGSALELWVALFLEHRREHFSGPIGIDLARGEVPILDELCREFIAQLRAIKASSS
jgi:hypothetical protein